MLADWTRTVHGTKNKKEAGFILVGTPSDYNIVELPLPDSNPNPCQIIFDPKILVGAFALFHIHPDGCDPDLSPTDRTLADQKKLSIYAESSKGLYEYSTITGDIKLADLLVWTKPCN